MTSDVLVRFARAGGRPPPDDERVVVRADGPFDARLTLGGRRVGSFEGRLDARALAGLRRAVEAIGAASDLTIPTPPDGATETVEAAGRLARIGSNETPPPPWRALVGRLRRMLDETVPQHPLAAVELDASSHQARLAHAGTEPLELDPASVRVHAVRLDPTGLVLGRWYGPVPEPKFAGGRPSWSSVSAGWAQELPFDHHLELAPGDLLQVWVSVRLRQDGERDARLYVPVIAGRQEGGELVAGHAVRRAGAAG